jgi:membrane associated rhomboid family serine protease
METTVTKKQLQNYLFIAILTGLVGVFAFILLGYFEFFVGSIQLIFALIKTIYQYIRDKSISRNMKLYWKIVFFYFLTMVLLSLIISNFITNSNHTDFFWSFYISTAWGIAIYHFRHIMFPKQNK